MYIHEYKIHMGISITFRKRSTIITLYIVKYTWNQLSEEGSTGSDQWAWAYQKYNTCFLQQAHCNWRILQVKVNIRRCSNSWVQRVLLSSHSHKQQINEIASCTSMQWPRSTAATTIATIYVTCSRNIPTFEHKKDRWVQQIAVA